MERIVVGAAEEITIKSFNGLSKKVEARMDTGARLGSIDIKLAAELKLGPVVREKKVRSASGKTVRPVVVAIICLKGKEIEAEMTMIDRSHMSFPVLIGRNVLKHGFVVDVNKE